MPPRQKTYESVLREGASILAGCESAQLDARVLMKFVTGLDDAGLILRGAHDMPAEDEAAFLKLIARRAAREPIAYITGVREFWSLDFHVTPDVLIPRADSECLIEAVLKRRAPSKPWTVLDLGVGSGCLLCALLHEMPSARGLGIDRSKAALEVAKDNAARLGLGARASFIAADWASGVEARFDIIIANPPYIPAGEKPALPADVSDFEPSDALFSGTDGFDAYGEILRAAPRLLAPEGLLILEAGDGQAARLRDMVSKALPGAQTTIVNDLKGLARGVLAEGKTFAEKD